MTTAANLTFVDAMTNGFIVSAAILIATLRVVLMMIPVRMRQDQATSDEALEVQRQPPEIELAGELQLVPVPVRIDQ